MPQYETASSQTQPSQSSQAAKPVTPAQIVGPIRVAADFIHACDDIVTDYRRDRLSRTDAMVRLLRRADEERLQPGFSDHNKVYRSLALYINSLENAEEENNQAARDAMRQFDQAEEQDNNVDTRNERRLRRKRRRDDDVDSDDGAERIDLGLIPFDKPSAGPMTPIDVWKLTAKLQENYARDPALVERKVLASHQRPDFPMSLWGDVISNSYIDLNQLFDFHFATDGPSRRSVQHFGESNIVTTTSIRPEKSVPLVTGIVPGIGIKRPSFSSIRTEHASSSHTPSTSSRPLSRLDLFPIGSSNMTNVFAPVSQRVSDLYFPTLLPSNPSTLNSSTVDSLPKKSPRQSHLLGRYGDGPPMLAGGSTLDTAPMVLNADSSMSVSGATAGDIPVSTVKPRSETSHRLDHPNAN
ncbi:hypothetical protein BGW80DRAFT_1384941, partial [Lactifluus volemus]